MFDVRGGFNERTGKALAIALIALYFGTFGGLAAGAAVLAKKKLAQRSVAEKALEIEMEKIERNKQR
ncbi:MAG: hypothetical protein LBD94_01690 [Rickettsiales bacterium]|jgi:hypothetical protein|nr:hypothetical protein [Rickettsiales bacterium]